MAGTRLFLVFANKILTDKK